MTYFAVFAVPKSGTSLITIPIASKAEATALPGRQSEPMHFDTPLTDGVSQALEDQDRRSSSHLRINSLMVSTSRSRRNLRMLLRMMRALRIVKRQASRNMVVGADLAGVVENFDPIGETGAWAIAQDMIKLEFRE